LRTQALPETVNSGSLETVAKVVARVLKKTVLSGKWPATPLDPIAAVGVTD
jgi:hypothetical protein